jgi:hypothetical protein
MNEKLNNEASSRLQIQDLNVRIKELESENKTAQGHEQTEDGEIAGSHYVEKADPDSLKMEQSDELIFIPAAVNDEVQDLPIIQELPTIINIPNTDADKDAFKKSRDTMFMPTLEVDIKLGTPVIVNHLSQEDESKKHQEVITQNSNKAVNMLLRLKKITR